ncbi:MAG TPA: hypothetical protein VMR48_06400, partial [Gaiellaceae bacterium]|nr:hypothetical protein [Gaiellaceae bacterium]
MGENEVERPWNTIQIELLDEEARVPDLTPPAAAHEAPELVLQRASPPRRHLLQRPEPVQIVVGCHKLLHPRPAQGPDQLLLEIGVAHIETETLEVSAREIDAEPRP